MLKKVISTFEPLVKGFSSRQNTMLYYTKILESNTVRILAANGTLLEVNLDKGGTVGEFSTKKHGEMFVIHDDFHLLGNKRKNVKGNHPIFPLFNSPINSTNILGANQPLPNHGIARLSTATALYNSSTQQLRLLMNANSGTLLVYPAQFSIIQTLSFTDSSLRLDFEVVSEKPFCFGYHPYFNVGQNWCITGFHAGQDQYLYLPNTYDKNLKDAAITNRAFLPFRKFDSAGELNHHFRDVHRPISILDYDNQRKITIESSLAQRTVFYDPNSKGLCIEPISAMSGQFTEKYDQDTPPYKLSGYVNYSFGII